MGVCESVYKLFILEMEPLIWRIDIQYNRFKREHSGYRFHQNTRTVYLKYFVFLLIIQRLTRTSDADKDEFLLGICAFELNSFISIYIQIYIDIIYII